jgi:hypothetical protein
MVNEPVDMVAEVSDGNLAHAPANTANWDDRALAGRRSRWNYTRQYRA